MPVAYVGLKESPHYRRDAFAAGFRALGFEIRLGGCERPSPGDVLCIWNRYGRLASNAEAFERAGCTVLVAENGYFGNDFAGDRWYAISRNQHNGAGVWPDGGHDRWDALGVELRPWRSDGELVVLPQRGIGPQGVAMPRSWPAEIGARLNRPHRMRLHPGVRPCKPLEDDLSRAGAVVTWGSGAALKALVLGVPVFYDFPRWIGAQAGKPLRALLTGEEPLRDDAARLSCFRRIAWAMWRLREIESGEAFRWLLTDSARSN